MVSLKIVFVCALLLVAAVMPSYGKFYILDDREVQQVLRPPPPPPVPYQRAAATPRHRRAVPQRNVQLDEAASEARIRRDGGDGHGVTGPVHTYVKTDKHANFKWGVRHHVGHQYAG